jgi:hypothetical protein
MGWLFALALGLQEKRRSAVARALLPIALGHAAAIAIAIVILYFFQHLFSFHSLRWPVAAIIFVLGIYRLFKASHPRGGGMRVGGRDLFVWSFLMASAHGAGLMLIPVLLGGTNNIVHHDMSSSHEMNLSSKVILLSVLVHTAAMLIVAGTLAIVFFELYNKVGLRVLRSTWINFDLLWAVALLVAGCIVLLE